MFNLKTLVDVFSRVVSTGGDRRILWQDTSGNWQPMSTRAIAARVYALANAFERWGIGKGDRIALLSENRWEWPITDFAALVIGAVDVPIYPTLTAEQTGSLLIDSGARIAVVSTMEQYRKIAAIRHKTPLERILVMDELVPDSSPGEYASPSSAARVDQAAHEATAVACETISFSFLLEGADSKAASVDLAAWLDSFNVQPPDLATLIYTSGTTGEPKGVMLTHGNIASNLNHSTEEFDWSSADSAISFLPLSHITARHLDYALFCYGATLAYCPKFEGLPGALRHIQPTVFVAVPRVYEKIREEVERRAALKPVSRKIFALSLRAGKRHREEILRGQRPSALAWRIADRLVFRKVGQAFGGKVRHYLAGGAPLGLDTAGWFADVGIRIYEGYGLTETSPVVALNNTVDHRIGSVGKPLPSVECRIAPDGELLVRGPSVFIGYWRKPDATSAAIDGEGWFSTGDIARLDQDGFLYVTDRKKELIKTSGGKMIAPQPIENMLKASTLIGNAALIGDRYKFLSAILSPNFAALEGWARGQGIPSGSRADLIRDPRVYAEYLAIVERVNSSLAAFETIKRFVLVPDEWSIESGELTPSMKLMRRVVLNRYRQEIAAFYQDPEAPRA